MSGLHTLVIFPLQLFNLLSKHFFVAVGWGALKRSTSLTTKNADCFLWFQISSKHFLSEPPSSNYPAAEDLLLITERLQFKRQPTSKTVTNDDTCFGLHSLVIYTPKGRVNQFLCKFNSTSDNAALFSNSHKLGIHQPGSLDSNEDSQSLSGSGGGGITLCQKGAKYKERTRIHQGSEHWVNSLRQNSEVFKSQCERKDWFPLPPLASLWKTV